MTWHVTCKRMQLRQKRLTMCSACFSGSVLFVVAVSLYCAFRERSRSTLQRVSTCTSAFDDYQVVRLSCNTVKFKFVLHSLVGTWWFNIPTSFVYCFPDCGGCNRLPKSNLTGCCFLTKHVSNAEASPAQQYRGSRACACGHTLFCMETRMEASSTKTVIRTQLRSDSGMEPETPIGVSM